MTATKDSESRRRSPSLTATAGMASYLDSGALVASGFAIGGFYVDPLGLDALTVGALLGLQTLSFATGAIAGGRLGDHLGRRRVLVTSLGVYACGVAVLAGAHHPTTLALGCLLTGLAIGADLPSSLALIAEEAPTRKARSLVIAQLLWLGGLGATGILALALADHGELAGRLLFVHLLIVSLAVLALRVNLPESREWRAARQRADGRTPDHATTAELSEGVTASQPAGLTRSRAAAGGAVSSPAGPDNRTRRMLAPAVIAITAYYTLWNLGANTLGQFRPYLWTQLLAGTERGAALLMLLPLPIAVISGVLFARVADRPRRARWVVAGSLLTAAGWLAVTISPSPVAFSALVICFAAGAAVSGEAMYKIWVHEFVPTLARATVQGTSLAVARVAAAAFALVTPTLALADPRGLFAALCGAQVAATLIAVRLSARSGP